MLGYNLKLEQKQKLIMTSELQQAIKILQFSSLELKDYVEQMMVENPLIEVGEEEKKSEIAETEVDWEEYLRESESYGSSFLPREVKEDVCLENMISEEQNLQEYLFFQLGCLRLNPLEQRIGRYLIGNIDSAGYLTTSVEQTAHALGAGRRTVEDVLRLVQSFEPAGIGARNLQECLLLQLRQKNNTDQDLRRLVENYLQDIGLGKLQKVAAAMHLSVVRVQELADLLKGLNPKPGASYSSGEETRYIVPDVLIERVEGEFVILVNDSFLPRLTINRTYSAILNKVSQADESTKNFVVNKMNQALWLMRSIEQRRMTIYRVTEALLRKQIDFFNKGIMFLKPLTMKQVAKEIGVHESTVSRATSNKYVQTPHGIFEFKFFFTNGLSTSTGNSTSSEIIKQLLLELIKNEDITRPYSDQKLVALLQEQGIQIARRTMAKYREELGVLSSAQRRRYQ